MPPSRHSFRRTMKRFADANAYKTADIVPGRMVAPVGSYRKIRIDEKCTGFQLVKSSTPPVNVQPGSSVGVLSSRGQAPDFVLEAAPAGRGGSAPEQFQSGFSALGEVAPLPSPHYWGITSVANKITVDYYDHTGANKGTIWNDVQLPGSGGIGTTGYWTITENANFPGDGFTLTHDDTVWAANFTIGSFTSLFDYDAAGESILKAGVYYDKVAQKVYIATYPNASPDQMTLRVVNPDGNQLAVVKTHTAADGNYYSSGFSACVWASDRLIVFRRIGVSFSACDEIPFDGGDVVEREEDGIGVTGLPFKFDAAGDRYFRVQDGDRVCAMKRMPLTSGDAEDLGWPEDTFYDSGENPQFACRENNHLVAWPLAPVDSSPFRHLVVVQEELVPTADDLVDLDPDEPYVLLAIPRP